jgi:hypothetical protein
MVGQIVQQSRYGLALSIGTCWERDKVSTTRWLRDQEGEMFIILFALLLLAWLGGFLVFHVSSALIHILLLFAVIALVAHLFQRKAVA